MREAKLLFLNENYFLQSLLQTPAHATKKTGAPQRPRFSDVSRDYNNGTINSATMLIILINGFTAGPAVSL